MRDRQAEAGAALAGGETRSADAPDDRVGHPVAGVGEAEPDLVGGAGAGDPESSASGPHGVDRVDGEVQDRVTDGRRRDEDRCAVPDRLEPEVHPGEAADQYEERQELGHEVVEHGRTRRLAGRAKQAEQPVDQLVCSADLRLEDADALQRGIALVRRDTAPDQLGIDDGGMNRILDLVREILGQPTEQIEAVRPDLKRGYGKGTRFHPN